jgi:hypothetical protein
MSYKSDIADVMNAMRKLIRLSPDRAVEMTRELQPVLELLVEVAELSSEANGSDSYPEGSFKMAFKEYIDLAEFAGNV